ncbi:MAG TPA: hypothetical protein VMW58_03215 [Anaerolineae bacterium]|nr:hypothetical protein [Anaerolineae bacterium]
MPHDSRSLMKPPPVCTFDQVFEEMLSQPDARVIDLVTTGGVVFGAQAKDSPRVGRFISLPHNNRIYPCCWGNTTNHMGNGEEGQRIGQYARPLAEWCQSQLAK